MRPFLALSLALLVGCADADAPAAQAEATPSAPSATYADAESFCQAVVSEAFVREHFGVPADVPITQSAGRFGCSGYWGAASEYDPAATQYGFTVVLADDAEEAATRFANATETPTAAENQADVDEALGEAAAEQGPIGEALVDGIVDGIGGTSVSPVGDLGDAAAVVRVGDEAPLVALRYGTVVVTDLRTWPNAWGRDVEGRAAEMEARGLAFARALVARM